MKGCARLIDWNAVPSQLSQFISQTQTFVTPGKDYSVYGVSVYDHVVFVLVIDDLSTPVFVPSWLFDLSSMQIPKDWVLTLSPGDNLDLILGPGFIARDIRAYNALVDQETEALDRFWKYVDTDGHSSGAADSR